MCAYIIAKLMMMTTILRLIALRALLGKNMVMISVMLARDSVLNYANEEKSESIATSPYAATIKAETDPLNR